MKCEPEELIKTVEDMDFIEDQENASFNENPIDVVEFFHQNDAVV